MTAAMISTRDVARTPRSYTDVLLEGLAPDGGLYVPAALPSFTIEELQGLQNAPYEAVAYATKKKLVQGSIPDNFLRAMIGEAYDADLFPHERGDITSLTEIGNGMYIENISLGPTASFKDMAMQLLAREMEYELKHRGKNLVILGATSGDTGSAAEAAFKGRKNIALFMLSPEAGMSDFQKAQMGSLSGGNIVNVSVRGRFDDCQDLVKEVKRDPEFASLGAVNSINWARISAQIPYYVSGYLRAVKKIGEPVDFCVPSGNFGNVLSGYYAKRMGIPIRRLIVATNENNVLHALFTTGVYKMTPARITSSPSMDISKASNYERLAFELFDQSAVKTSAYMQEFNEHGCVSLADYGSSAAQLRDMGFESGTSTHADRLETIRRVYQASDVTIDPHTADGVHVASTLKKDAVPIVCFATALPVKFEDTIREALGFIPEQPKRFSDIRKNASGFITTDADVDALKRILRDRVIG